MAVPFKRLGQHPPAGDKAEIPKELSLGLVQQAIDLQQMGIDFLSDLMYNGSKYTT